MPMMPPGLQTLAEEVVGWMTELNIKYTQLVKQKGGSAGIVKKQKNIRNNG